MRAVQVSDRQNVVALWYSQAVKLSLVATLELPVPIQAKEICLQDAGLDLAVEYVLQPYVELCMVDLVDELGSRQLYMRVIRLLEVELLVRAVLGNQVLTSRVDELALIVRDLFGKRQMQLVVNVILEK